jgi:hypothetical protein
LLAKSEEEDVITTVTKVCDSLDMTGKAKTRSDGNMSWHHERRRVKESRVARMMA